MYTGTDIIAHMLRKSVMMVITSTVVVIVVGLCGLQVSYASNASDLSTERNIWTQKSPS